MDSICRGPATQRDPRVLNKKEDRDFQHRLIMLDKQYRYAQKMLKLRQDSLMKQQRKVVMVKVCEPKATVTIAMKEIDEHKNAETLFGGLHTSNGTQQRSSKSPHHNMESELEEKSRPISAPPPAVTSPVRHRGPVQRQVSLMQMKNIATIDSISEKELARQQQQALEEMERMRQRQKETLHKRVTAFIESLKDKANTGKWGKLRKLESPFCPQSFSTAHKKFN
ncbi:hypothetical protein Q5P01_020794 [Channa striata]|uniref:Uncharacterized protein n=1 Tax=Channa striata TaxID=64152 RepID=A0AA88LZD9_CHASR|nr:hypothetical protein Q5P01_020794 [Channa striata]